MAGIMKLFSAAMLSGPMVALALPVGAQTAPVLTAEQMQAVAIANGFNKCIRDGYDDPVYVSNKLLYEQALVRAQKEYESRRAVYLDAQKAFKTAYDNVIARDGYKEDLDNLSRLFAQADDSNNFAARGVFQTQIGALHEYIVDKVIVETGRAEPVPPDSADKLVTVTRPQEPFEICNTNLKRVLETMNLNEVTLSILLSEVLEIHGARKYNELTGGPAFH